MLKLKLQYFGHLMWRTDSEKTLMLGKIEGRRKMGWQRMRWLDGINGLNGHELEQAQRVVDGQESLVCCSPWDCKELDMMEQLNWQLGIGFVFFIIKVEFDINQNQYWTWYQIQHLDMKDNLTYFSSFNHYSCQIHRRHTPANKEKNHKNYVSLYIKQWFHHIFSYHLWN